MATSPLNSVNPELQTIEKQHRREIMVLDARPLLARVMLGLWIGIDAILLIFFVWQVIWYLVSGSFFEVRDMAKLGANVGVMHEVVNNRAANDLIIAGANILKSSDSASDFYTLIENPNEDWYATFSYVFSYSDGNTGTMEGYVMPGEEKYLIALNVKSDVRPSSADISLSNVVWHYVDRHEVSDVGTWIEEHDNFIVSDASHITDIELSEDKIARSLFTITNASAYAYWEPVFTILLKRNGVIVGLNQATVQRFEAQESRDVEVHWSGDAVTTGTPTILPNLNYFDSSSYMMPGGSQANDWRDIYGD